MFRLIVIFIALSASLQSLAFEISLKNRESNKVTEDKTLIEMIEFIQEWSGYKHAGEPLPKAQFLKHELVQIYAYGEYEYAQAEFNKIQLDEVSAVYDLHSKTIHISENLKEKPSLVKMALVHELVHYMQDINGYTESLGEEHRVCTESEAYDIQILWQVINEVELDRVDDQHQLSLIAAMRCMGSPFANN
jgi:hypothetical protein